MSIPTSRATLIDYCLRSLGAPVLEINIDEDQINDRIDDAMQFYREYHSDAIVKQFRKVQVTPQMKTDRYITLPDAMLFVSRVLPLVNSGSYSSSSNYMFSAKYQMYMNDIYDLRASGTMVNYAMTRQYLEMLDMLLNSVPPCRFNRHMNRLFIDVDWQAKLEVGDWILIEGYETIDPDLWPDIYNDAFLKAYATALIKKNWGTNMIKFEGIQLPGGITMNGRQIYDDALAEIEKLETECQLKWSMPVDFFVG